METEFVNFLYRLLRRALPAYTDYGDKLALMYLASSLCSEYDAELDVLIKLDRDAHRRGIRWADVTWRALELFSYLDYAWDPVAVVDGFHTYLWEKVRYEEDIK